MKPYLDLLKHILENGERRQDRTGTGTIAVFGTQVRYDLSKGFPAITTKKLYWKGVVYELLWFLKGDTNIKYLVDNGVNIWNDDAYRYYQKIIRQDGNWKPFTKEEFIENIKSFGEPGKRYYKNPEYYQLGDLGPIYGKQWRSWNAEGNTIDQIENLITAIKTDPFSRRHILTAWNVAELDSMGLPPCHPISQYCVSNDGKLSCSVYMRSNDIFLGAPFNVASYALLTHMIAHVCGLGVGDLIMSIGDAHIYSNHIDQVKEQLSREPLELPQLKLNPDIKNINDFTYNDIELVGYNSYSAIKAKLSVGL